MFRFHLSQIILHRNIFTYHAVVELPNHTRQFGCASDLSKDNCRIWCDKKSGWRPWRSFQRVFRIMFFASTDVVASNISRYFRKTNRIWNINQYYSMYRKQLLLKEFTGYGKLLLLLSYAINNIQNSHLKTGNLKQLSKKYL